MGLAIREHQGNWCPMVECDVCENPINEGASFESRGAYLWRLNYNDGSSDGRIVFVHKGTCHHAWEDAHPLTRGMWLWMDIREFIVTLAWNLGFKHEASAIEAWREQRAIAQGRGIIPKRQRSSRKPRPEDRAIILKRDRRCRECGADDVPLEVDHIIPNARGGTSDIANLQALCQPCNRQKRTTL